MIGCFCVDEGGLSGLTNEGLWSRAEVHRFVDLVEDLLSESFEVCCSSKIDESDIGQSLNLNDLYGFNYSATDVHHGIDRDLWLRLVRLRGQLSALDQEPICATLTSSSGTVVRAEEASRLAAVVRFELAKGVPPALIAPCSSTAGVHAFTCRDSGQELPVFVVKEASMLPYYYRWLIPTVPLDEDQFLEIWDPAFPNLRRSDTISFRRFHGTYESVRDAVIEHLSFLNDEFSSTWASCGMDFPVFARKAKAMFGIEFSNESAKTRASAKKMGQRDAVFGSRAVRCELHTKLERAINRIHFHPPILDLDKRLLVGIFVDHLDT